MKSEPKSKSKSKSKYGERTPLIMMIKLYELEEKFMNKFYS